MSNPGLPSPSSDRLQGQVAMYKPDKGFGFIDPPSGPAVFFHVSQLECSVPYEGEALSFRVRKGREGRDEATEIRRLASDYFTGDILDWKVDPGTFDARGHVLPHSGGDPIAFTGRDLVKGRTESGRAFYPRPWHGARFQVVTVAGAPRAVDLQIDWRYPLQRFAFLGDEQEIITSLKNLALEEDWDYRTSKSKKPNEILYNYLQFTFARLVDEDRATPLEQRKIRIRQSIPDHTPLATFNTGLVDKRFEPIFALFEPNESGRQQRWRFLAFCIPGEDAGKLLARYFNPLPSPARYFTQMSELLFDPDAPLHPDYAHILNENRERLPTDLLRTIEHLEPGRAENVLKMHLDRAIDLAQKRARWNFKTAIPHYFPTLGRLDFLLPLCLMDDSTVDVALAVARAETGYLANTVLPLDWAYKSARLVCRPDSDWLAPSSIDAGTTGDAAGDDFSAA